MNANLRFAAKMLSFCPVILSVLVSAAQTLQSKKPRVRNPCSVPTTQLQQNGCSLREYQQADGRLNALFRKIRQSFERDFASYKDANDERRESTQVDIQKLDAAQEAWTNYQKAHCDAVAHEYEHGSFQP